MTGPMAAMAAMADFDDSANACYNVRVDDFRRDEYPMLHGKFIDPFMRKPLLTRRQDPFTWTMPGQHLTPSR